MEPTISSDHIDAFVIELLRTGMSLSNTAASLIEDLPPDAYPGEDLGDVVLGMMVGTIRTALEAFEPRVVEQATALIELAAERVIEHLRLALALSKHMDGPNGRRYG
ncbi:MAG: hypothetical protein ACYDHH_21480 [Solirubrobacteraceae bacterium]